jgi:hypothetical protein
LGEARFSDQLRDALQVSEAEKHFLVQAGCLAMITFELGAGSSQVHHLPSSLDFVRGELHGRYPLISVIRSEVTVCYLAEDDEPEAVQVAKLLGREILEVTGIDPVCLAEVRVVRSARPPRVPAVRLVADD